MINKILLLGILLCVNYTSFTQSPGIPKDSVPSRQKQLNSRFISIVSSKTDKYYTRVSGKTENLLKRLVHWEEKIKKILDKLNPEISSRLFSDRTQTFGWLLEKYKLAKEEGDKISVNTIGAYNEYQDKIITGIKFMESGRDSLNHTSNSSIKKAKVKSEKLLKELSNSEEIQRFIKIRKKQLMDNALKYASNHKYFQKITKETYYYIESLRNYKELFSDTRKTEELALKLLEKIPGFSDFFRKNSILSSLFPALNNQTESNMESLAGLQSRAQISRVIQQQFVAGGANAQQQFHQNFQLAQTSLNELKNRVIMSGGTSSDPTDNTGFKPNMQKTKTFWQRIEYGVNIQPQKSNNLLPNNSDLGVSLGYKLSDHSVFGFGVSYKLGLGTGINNFKFTTEGMGVRSFIDWKIKGGFWLSGGYERNYRKLPAIFNSPVSIVTWRSQESGLLGISKRISIKTKLLKQTNVRVYWDILSYQQIPKSQPVVFRIGYNF